MSEDSVIISTVSGAGMSRGWRIALWVAGAGAVTIVVALAIGASLISRHARDWVDDWLTQKYNSDVDLESFHITFLYPMVQVHGDNLSLYFLGRGDLPPLISVDHFLARASFWGLLRNPRRIQYAELKGLQINIPPRDRSTADGDGKLRATMRKIRDIRFGEIVSENAVLKILTSKPGKDPLEFDIKHLALHSSAMTDGEMIFHATLKNPKPPGDIVSDGKFGPWSADVPSLTPVSGSYTFENADLGIFRGIGGTLSSRGKYDGVLEEIHVNGTTDTPDFQVTRAGHPVHLTTTFDATVDGTDGDTYLHPVTAHFQNSTLVCQGSIEGTKGTPGKTITLDVIGDQADIADLLLLAVKESAPMTGPVRLQTKFVLKPGKQEIPDRLTLDGSFGLHSVHFTSGTVQQKVDNMSKRSLGKPNEVDKTQIPDKTDDVASEMQGKFKLDNGTLTASRVGFQIPGADIQLNGTYNLKQEDLDFHGTVELQAKLSQTVTGAKSFFLKVLDPFFSKNGKGTVLPIKITGSLQHPNYGLDFHHKKDTADASR